MIHIQESIGILWLIPDVVALVMLTRWLSGPASIHPIMVGGFSSAIQAGKCLLHGYGCAFPVLWLAVVSVGVIIVLWVLPFGLWWFAGAVLLAIVSVCSSPKWLR